jgi:uncharacterized OsmC-like protein
MSSERIRGSIEGVVAYLETHPDDATSTDPPAVAVRDGELRFRATGPSGQEVVTDMARAVGGDGSAPSPGWLLRAALATCDATVIAMEADSDDRGLFGIDGIAPGPLVVRTRIRLGADDADEVALREVLAAAEANSPVADAIRRAIDTRTEVDFV